MSLRRLHHDQPDSFAFTPANLEWAKGQIAKFPEGRQASAVIPILWRAQEQEGWVSRPMIEEVARMLGMEPIRVLEVATFYFMFHLHPVGSVAHVQVCGTTSCMICGAEDLIGVCKEKIGPRALEPSADGRFSWEEVECLGACSNAPMAQIGKDYYEDLTAERFAWILDEFAAGRVPEPGPQTGRWASEPATGRTSLEGVAAHEANASVTIARALGDTIKRIDGTERTASDLFGLEEAPAPEPPEGPRPGEEPPSPETAPGDVEAALAVRDAETAARPPGTDLAAEGGAEPVSTAAGAGVEPTEEDKPELLSAPRGGAADDLKRIKGVGPKLETVLNELGVYHFDQIAGWSAREIAWVDEQLTGFRGRILRDEWVAQAQKLAAGEAGTGADDA